MRNPSYRFIGRRLSKGRYTLTSERGPDGAVLLSVRPHTAQTEITFLPDDIDELLDFINLARGGEE